MGTDMEVEVREDRRRSAGQAHREAWEDMGLGGRGEKTVHHPLLCSSSVTCRLHSAAPSCMAPEWRGTVCPIIFTQARSASHCPKDPHCESAAQTV